MRDPMRLRSPFILRARFNPASLFGSGETGFVLDLDADALSTRTPGTGVQTITTAVKGATFSQGTATARPTYQLDTRPYLQFDGVDDWMSLASLDMGGSDAVTVIAGMRRGQNVNNEELFSISLNAQNNVANPGAFVMSPTVDAGTNNAGFSSQGGGTYAIARASSSSIGVDYVLTGIGDISADTCIVRRNGTQLGSDAADQGATAYGNYAAYLGARGGLSRYCNIRLYGLIVINRVLTATELAAAEKWIGAKCGVAL